MNVFAQSLLDSSNIIAEAALSKSTLPKTIECEIIELKDAAIGLYSVSYMGNVIDVYSASTAVTYDEGDPVLVLIPDGDMSKTKYILGAVNPNGDMYTPAESVISNKIVENVKLLYFNDISLCSYTPETIVIPFDSQPYIDQLAGYINSKKLDFVFCADVMTAIPGIQQKGGNYGLYLTLPILVNNTDGTNPGGMDEANLIVKMDVTTMQGNVYNFKEFIEQKITVAFPDNAIYDTLRQPTLTAFVENFQNQAAGKPDDIFFTNISLRPVSILDLDNNNGNCLTIIASEGSFFAPDTNQSNTKTLSLALKIGGKDKKIDNYACYWFVEDMTVNSANNDGYLAYGGYGWRCLNEKKISKTESDGSEQVELITNVYTYDVNKDDVATTLRYKCVLIQDSFSIEGKIEIENLQPAFEIDLATVNGPTYFVKDFGKINLVARIRSTTTIDMSNYTFSTNWLRYKEDGVKYEEEAEVPEFIRINDLVNGWYETEVSYPATYIKDYSNIFCTFTEESINGIRTIGTKNIVITTGEDFVYRLSPIVDRTDYKYDAEGNSPKLSNTNYDGPASSVTSVIKPISFEIRDKEGKELSENEYKYCQVTWMFPKDSMLVLGEGMSPSAESEDYYYLIFTGKEESNLTYDIQPIFYPEKDNTIILEVSFSGYTLRTSIPFTFLKDGRSGTNGTKFSAVITYNGHAYGEEYKDNDGKILRHRFLPIYISPQWHWESCLKVGIYQPRTENGEYNKIVDYPTIYDNLPTFSVKVCKDGQLIESSGNYSVSWSMMDPNVCHPWFDIDSQGKLSLNSYFNTSIKNHAWPESYSDFGDGGDVDCPCNIIRAAVTINSNATDTNTKQIIYAYYPIDFIFMSLRESESTFDPNKEYNLPIIEDGFWEAIYAADGTNPQYNNTNPFTFGDNSRVYDLKALAEEEYGTGQWFYGSINNFIVTDYTNTSFEVKPTHKYASGATQNVIGYKVEFPYNYETERTVIEDKISDIEKDLVDLQNAYTIYSSFCSYLTSFQHQLDNDGIFSYNNIMKAQLAKCKEMLAARSMVISNLDELYDKVLDMQSYCSDKDITFTPSLEDILLFFKNDNSSSLGVRNILLLLGDSKAFDDVPEYLVQSGCMRLAFSDESVISNYGLGVYQTLSDKVNSFNELLRIYFNNIAEMKSYYDGLDDFTNFRSIMNNFLNSNTALNYLTIQANMGEEFKSFKNIQNERFRSLSIDCYSYADINDLLAKMKSSYDTFKQTYYNDKYNTLASNKLQEIHLEECKIQDLTAADIYELVRYYKPIYMAYNPYGNSNMNLWDGQKLYVGDDERYMFAPQFGAGYKDNTNRFTGIYMGLESTNEDTGNYTNMKVGIIARHENEETMFLNAKNGAAIFGKSSSGGQIIIDPVQGKGELYSSNYYRSYNSSGVNYGLPTSYGESNMTYQGMKISLSDACIHFGNIYNNNGKIYSGHHSALTSTEDGFYMDKDGLSIGSKFKVDASGVLSLGIGATAGDSSRKHWTIDGSGVNSYIAYGATSLNTSNGQIYIGTDGISLGTGFKVDSNGNITATSGSIAGWNITSSAIECGSGSNKITISSTGSITGPGWALNKDGSGRIGGWNIGTSDNIYTLNSAGGSLTLDGTNGKIIGPGFRLDSTGLIMWKNGLAENSFSFNSSTGDLKIYGEINATKGQFGGAGGWTVSEGGIYSTEKVYEGVVAKLTPTFVSASTGKFEYIECFPDAGYDQPLHGLILANNVRARYFQILDGSSYTNITTYLQNIFDQRYVKRGESHRHMIYLQGTAYPTEYTNL